MCVEVLGPGGVGALVRELLVVGSLRERECKNLKYIYITPK